MKFILQPRLPLYAGIGLFTLTGSLSAVPQGLLDGLGDESYQAREKAENELAKWAKGKGENGLKELDKLKQKARSPEVKSRLDNVISGVTIYKAVPGTRGFMGISMNPMVGGSVISGVTPGTPAEKAGLKANDRIIELDGVDLTKKNANVNEATDFLRIYVKGKNAGEKLRVKIDRDGEIIDKELKLADYDEFVADNDPFGGGFNNGGNQFIPLQGNIQIQPRNVDPKQLIEDEVFRLGMNLKVQDELMRNADLPEEFKKQLKQQNDSIQKRIDRLKKELDKKEFLKK